MSSTAGRPGRGTTPPELPGLDFVAPLGSGGYSDVYLYEQQMPRMKVAVKVLAAQHLSDHARRQFSAEANAMAQLADHPFIVQVFRADIAADGRPYIVMKYYPQPNLATRARAERFAVSEVLKVGIQICSAVEAAHRIGILHRDIKPANVLSGQYGTLGLTDFGIAATKAEAAAGQTDGVSIPWAAPEVLYSAERADERSDVYSIAATLWHLLVGRSPFENRGGDNSALALMHRITSSPPPPTGRGDVPASLERLLHNGLAKDPANRPASALAFARGLQAIEQEQRLALTPIVVADDGGAGRAAVGTINGRTDTADTDGTRVKQAVRVEGADARPASNPAAPSDDEATRRKQPTTIAAQPPAALPPWAPPVPSRGPYPGTGLHQYPPPGSPPTRTRSLRPAYLVAAGAVVAAVVGGIALVASGGSHRSPAQSPTVSDPGATQIAVPTQNPPPGTPVVIGARRSGAVIFSWSYDDRARGDSYQWRVIGSARSGAASVPQVSVPAAAGRTVCLQVRVLRLDGSAASAWSEPACA